jgi:hypothetical protein
MQHQSIRRRTRNEEEVVRNKSAGPDIKKKYY